MVVVRYQDETDGAGGGAEPAVSAASAAEDEDAEYHYSTDDWRVASFRKFHFIIVVNALRSGMIGNNFRSLDSN
ncbi:hypothetical protein Acr_08g0016340 [Actinidia rufa]|uniref:Uncharacterized protein n=1 Tax=Actinidia rufa TaxID=165716 RepID=A0A7J0F3G8_9ERIC|nr:hypothetical protein Acr_08g0016340 [Actinidia rufa]